MSRKLSVEEHIARGTYRPTRHGPRPKSKPTPVAPTTDEECWKIGLIVGHRCTRACTTVVDKPEVSEKDIRAEMRYANRFFGSADRGSATKLLAIRRDIYSPAEYRAITHAPYAKRRAGKAPADY